MCQVSIVDRGIGIPSEQLAEENRRLVERERLDIAPTGKLGLFVVGRLARRHGLTVELLPTPSGGTTAKITIPPTLFRHEAPVPALVGGSEGYARPTSATSPGVVTPRRTVEPAALAAGFSWFVPSAGSWSVGQDVTRPAPSGALVAECAPVPVSDESFVKQRHAVITPPAGVAPPADQQRRPRDGLIRRVRGAQLPAGAVGPEETVARRADRPTATDAVGDAAAARAAMDGFQAAITHRTSPGDQHGTTGGPGRPLFVHDLNEEIQR